MRAEGSCLPGGPLSGSGVPIPTQPLHREGRDALSLNETRKPRTAPAAPEASTAQIRAWAISRGYKVADRGGLPSSIRNAYEQEATR